MKTLSTSTPGNATRPHSLRTAAMLCASLLAASAAPAQAPPPAQTVAPAAAPVIVTRPLANQPGARPVTRRQAREADDAYLAGSALLEKNEPEKALKAFQRAASLDPEKQAYSVASAIALENVVSAMVRKSELMRGTGNATGADAVLAAAARLDPDNRIVTEHMRQDEAHVEIDPSPAGIANPDLRFAPPIEFSPDQTTKSFHFRAPGHEALRQVLQAYGLKVQFNDDVPSASVRLDIDDVSFQQMRPILEEMTQSFLVPIDPKTALALKDRPENHQQFDHLALETVYMPGFSTDDINDVLRLLQNVLGIEQVVVGSGSGTISIKAPPEMLKIVNYELADLMDGGSQLVLEMKVYAVDKTNMKSIGIPVGSSVTAFNVASQATQILNQFQPQIAAAIANGLIPANASTVQILEALAASGLLNNNPLLGSGVLTFGGGLTFTGVSPASLPSVNFGLNQSEARSLEDLQLSVGDRKTATFRVGTKFPITTATYTASGIPPSQLAGLSAAQLAALGLNSSAAATAATQTTVPQIQYEDLGLTLKAQPTVLRSGDVYIKLDLKIEALAGSSLNSIPVLGSRAFTSTVTLQSGQAAMLVTSLTREEQDAVSGIPGLSELPGFQSTTNKATDIDISELVITLTPRIVRHGHDRIAGVPLLLPASVKKNGDD
jgi:general secretion pathway protein D